MGDYWGPLGSSSFSEMEGQVQDSNADFSIVSSDSFGSDQNLTLRNMTIRKRHLVLVQIGISYGMPTKVTPHVQTGRADYFGPLVNLSARVAKGTKPGDLHVSSYTDLNSDDVLKPGPEHISWRGDRSVGPSSGGDGDDGH